MNELLRKLLFLPEQASTWSTRVDALHYFVIITTTIASFAIGITAIVFVIRYRRRPGQGSAYVVSPVWMETLIIGVPLSFFLLWFAIGFRDFVWYQSPPRDAVQVYVTGKMWMWKFAYADGPNGVEILTVPRGRPVRLLLTSRDVIHSFFVPAFRVKQDALPGRYTQTWFTATKAGEFDIFCTEYCGAGHSGMRGRVVVLEPEAFDRWLEAQQRALVARQDGGQPGRPATLVEQGRLAAVKHGCLRCHTVDGTPHIGPTWQGLYLRRVELEGGATVTADAGYLTESMMDPLAKIVAGFQPVMPSYLGQLDAPESAAIVEYIRSLGPEGPPPVPGGLLVPAERTQQEGTPGQPVPLSPAGVVPRGVEPGIQAPSLPSGQGAGPPSQQGAPRPGGGRGAAGKQRPGGGTGR